MPENFEPTLAATQARIAAVRPAAYARTRNALDGNLASNHLSWQWVAGTGSRKPYLFNAENVARYAPEAWPSPGSVIDTSYEALDRMARQPTQEPQLNLGAPPGRYSLDELRLAACPLDDLGLTGPDAATATDRDVWLVHPWSLGALPAALPPDTVVIGVFVADFHRAWPWSERRCDSFSQWWARATRGLGSAADLLAANGVIE